MREVVVYQETVAVRNVDNYVFPYAANLHFVQRIYQILISRLVRCLDDDGRSVFPRFHAGNFLLTFLFGDFKSCFLILKLTYFLDCFVVLLSNSLRNPLAS